MRTADCVRSDESPRSKRKDRPPVSSERACLSTWRWRLRCPLVLCPVRCAPAAVLGGPHVRADAPANVKRRRPPFQAMWHDWPTAAPLCPRVSSPHFFTVSQNPLSGDLHIKLEVFGVSKSASPLGARTRRGARLQRRGAPGACKGWRTRPASEHVKCIDSKQMARDCRWRDGRRLAAATRRRPVRCP